MPNEKTTLIERLRNPSYRATQTSPAGRDPVYFDETVTLAVMREAADEIERLQRFAGAISPGVSILLCGIVARETLRRPRLDTADVCAEKLRLSYHERMRLGITTIGAYDAGKRERAKRAKERKRLRDRAQAAQKRIARGAMPRAEYLASCLSATQPWKALGISRRT